MIEWRCVAQGQDGLRIYRIDAEVQNIEGVQIAFDPFALILKTTSTPTTRILLEDFAGTESAVGPTSFRVAAHVVSLPEMVLVVDSTFAFSAEEVFPHAIETILGSEGQGLDARPLRVLYTHAHFDHAGGHAAVEAMGDAVETIAHPHTRALQLLVSRKESFILTKGQFFRDCGLDRSLDDLREVLREAFYGKLAEMGVDIDEHPFGTASEEPLRVDRAIEPTREAPLWLGDRVEVLRFDGHIPGHLCVRVDRDHLITGDMWLPATTSTLTPGVVAEMAGVSADECGIARYIESSERLLEMDVDDCTSYPSHEVIFQNPKRMAMRDIELFEPRFDLIHQVLEEHRSKPMRVLDLAWGGERRLPIWKVNESKQRLIMAHSEAGAYVQDLVGAGDLDEVEPERYVWTGRTALYDRLTELLERARRHHGHLEFKSRGRA